MGWNSCDYIFIVFGCLGSMMCLLATVQGPYRLAAPATAINWPERKYYISVTTDKGMSPSVTWKYMKMEMCKKFEAAQLKYGTPTGNILSSALDATISLPICDVKPDCRQNMADRCTQYDRMVWNGLVLLIMVLLSGFLFGLALILMMLSGKVKAKKNAWTMGVMGTVVQTVALAYWIFDSDRFVKKMQALTVWPYPALNGWGVWTHFGGLTCIYCSVVMGFMSWAVVGDGKSSASYGYASYGGEYGEYGGAYPYGGQAI